MPIFLDGQDVTSAEALLRRADFKESVRLASTGNLSLSGLAAIDGVTPVAGDRILAKDQTLGEANGVYLAAAGAWTRAPDFDENAEVTSGASVFVSEGAVHDGDVFSLATADPIDVGTTVLVFIKTAGSSLIPHGPTHTETGSDPVPNATISVGGLLSGADKTKLDGIEVSAKDDQTLAEALALGNSTGGTDLQLSGTDKLLGSLGGSILEFSDVASAANFLRLINAATGFGPIIEPVGADANIDLELRGKASGHVILQSTGGKTGVGGVPDSVLTIIGNTPGIVGGFASGALQLRNPSTAEFANSVITLHSSFNTNTQLAYIGSVSSSNNDIAFINRQNGSVTLSPNNTASAVFKADGNTNILGVLQVESIASLLGDLDLTTSTGGVFQFNDNAFRAGLDAAEYVEVGHGGGNGFINAVGDGGLDLRFEGATLATFTDFGHLHLMTNVDQKHTLKIITANNLNDTGLAWENSGGSFTGTIFRTDVGSNRADLVFAVGQNADIDLLTDSFKLHGSAADEGRMEVLAAFQISSGGPGLGKVLTSDATGIATWQTASGGPVETLAQTLTAENTTGGTDIQFSGTDKLLGSLGNAVLQLFDAASAVNFIGLTSAATGSDPIMSPVGSDTDIDLEIKAKGTGQVNVGALLTIVAGAPKVVRTAVSNNTAAMGLAHKYAVTDTSVVRTITISSADITSVVDREFIIKDESLGAGTNKISVVTEGAEKIDGSSNPIDITVDGGVVRLYTNQTDLFSY